jgi:hypothetical protein
MTKVQGGCDRSAEDSYSFMESDPTFTFCCLTLDFGFALILNYHYVLQIVNFTILYTPYAGQAGNLLHR